MTRRGTYGLRIAASSAGVEVAAGTDRVVILLVTGSTRWTSGDRRHSERTPTHDRGICVRAVTSTIERLRYGRAVTESHDPAPTPPESNRLVGGRYRLGEVIGIGGMATVHRALDTRTGRSVAIKLLRREVIEDVDIAMRFRREALAATVLRHPNIVACLEAGTDDGQPFLVMDLIEGEDLAARLRRVGRLAPAEAARIGLDIARALG
ncbi:MAG: protein kinase, partial [Chloroflexi bacterium]|nr:protein kinase [Chloroflexota bacterium]